MSKKYLSYLFAIVSTSVLPLAITSCARHYIDYADVPTATLDVSKIEDVYGTYGNYTFLYDDFSGNYETGYNIINFSNSTDSILYTFFPNQDLLIHYAFLTSGSFDLSLSSFNDLLDGIPVSIHSDGSNYELTYRVLNNFNAFIDKLENFYHATHESFNIDSVTKGEQYNFYYNGHPSILSSATIDDNTSYPVIMVFEGQATNYFYFENQEELDHYAEKYSNVSDSSDINKLKNSTAVTLSTSVTMNYFMLDNMQEVIDKVTPTS